MARDVAQSRASDVGCSGRGAMQHECHLAACLDHDVCDLQRRRWSLADRHRREVAVADAWTQDDGLPARPWSPPKAIPLPPSRRTARGVTQHNGQPPCPPRLREGHLQAKPAVTRHGKAQLAARSTPWSPAGADGDLRARSAQMAELGALARLYCLQRNPHEPRYLWASYRARSWLGQDMHKALRHERGLGRKDERPGIVDVLDVLDDQTGVVTHGLDPRRIEERPVPPALLDATVNGYREQDRRIG